MHVTNTDIHNVNYLIRINISMQFFKIKLLVNLHSTIYKSYNFFFLIACKKMPPARRHIRRYYKGAWNISKTVYIIQMIKLIV